MSAKAQILGGTLGIWLTVDLVRVWSSYLDGWLVRWDNHGSFGRQRRRRCNYNTRITIRTWLSERANVKNVMTVSTGVTDVEMLFKLQRKERSGVERVEDLKKKDGKRWLIDLRNVKMSPIGQVKRRYGGWTQNGWEIDREEICDK